MSNILDEEKEDITLFFLTTLKKKDSIWLEPSQFDKSSLVAEYRESRKIMTQIEKGEKPTLRMNKARLRRHEQLVEFWKEFPIDTKILRSLLQNNGQAVPPLKQFKEEKDFW